jgi:beta-galactosidase
MVPDELLGALIASPAQVVLFPRCGSKVETVRIPADLPPGSLRALIDIRVTRVESLRPGFEEDVAFQDLAGRGRGWREHLTIGEGVAAEGRYADGGTAVAHQGRVRYLAGGFDPVLTRELLRRVAVLGGLLPRPLPDGVRIRRRGDLCFIFNYTDHAQELDLSVDRWLIGDAKVPPYGVSIAQAKPELS